MKKSLLTILVLLSMLAAVMGTAAAPMVSDPVVSRNLAVNLVGAKPATLKVENRTGGILYVKLAGPKNYSFSTSKQGLGQLHEYRTWRVYHYSQFFCLQR